MRHPLAVTYNDVSVLENHHVATLYKLLTENPDANVLDTMSSDEGVDARKQIIDMIVHTDMRHHFSLINKVGACFCCWGMCAAVGACSWLSRISGCLVVA